LIRNHKKNVSLKAVANTGFQTCLFMAIKIFLKWLQFFSDIITLKITSHLKSACPKMMELTLWSHL